MKNYIEQIKRLDAKITDIQKNLTKDEIKKCLCDGNNPELCKRLKRKK